MHQEILKPDYNVGEECWIYAGYTDKKDTPVRTQGAIVHVFTLPHHSNKYFVIEMFAAFHKNLEIRDIYTMSPSQDGSIGIFDQCHLSSQFFGETPKL